MTEDVRQVWLVYREYTDKGLVTAVYATPDGEHKHVEQLSANSPRTITAAKEVGEHRLEEADPEERDRYAEEVARMADRHDPDDAV